MPASLELIVANTNPIVEVYKVNDSAANNRIYVLAQDGASDNNPTALSIQIDYSVLYDRIADALETLALNSTIIKDSLNTIAAEITSIDNSLTSSNSHLNVIKNHFSLERAILAAVDIKPDDLLAIKAEIKNPTLP
jgi:hypothetical protein